MKNLTICLTMVFLAFACIPLKSTAASKNETTTFTANTNTATARETFLMTRLYEIKAMDKSAMSSSQKKELRKEIRMMKQEIRESNGGLYLSLGAILIILLLLIILL